MLPTTNRIKKKKDFDEIFKKGKSFKTSLLVLKIIENGLNENRFGFIISKKVSKKAVVRNKIKRKLTEMLKENIKPKTKGKDVIFIVLSNIEKNNFLEIKNSLSKILNTI